MKLLVIFLITSVARIEGSKDWSNDEKRDRWNKYSTDRIDEILNKDLNGNVAKNLIIFLGDGMGMTTVTAGRILKGQLKGNNGEEEVTNMESLDHVALSKTYNIDAQTADSAGTATAYLTGVKTRIGVVGLDGTAVDCATSRTAELESILKWAHYSGKSTGIVTTTRVTHATPSAAYAHVLDREWETFDGDKFNSTLYNQGCTDIASQLIDNCHFMNVVFGGGRKNFLRTIDSDYLDPAKKGKRIDERNLIDEWNQKMSEKNKRHKFLWNLTDFNALKADQYEHVFGMFNYDHMSYELDRVKDNLEPSLIEMTDKAIEILSANPNGFFLLVEGGNIDQAHHQSLAKKALHEYVVFDEAIGVGLNKTSSDDTLLIATADHSHMFTIGGYGIRGLDIFGTNINKWSNLSTSNMTYTPLIYGNGPGGLLEIRKFNLTNEMTHDDNYVQESAVYIYQETHGGEDVAIYASGPMSYLFTGTVEQSFIAHAMGYSACIGPYNSTKYPSCPNKRGVFLRSFGTANKQSNWTIFTMSFLFFILFINQ